MAGASGRGRAVARRRRGHFFGTCSAVLFPQDDGRVYIGLKYHIKVIEIEKGKSAIEVGERRPLEPVLETLQPDVVNARPICA